VEVIVDEAGDDSSAGNVDDLRIGAGVARNLRTGAPGDDAAVGYGQGFDHGELGVDSQDLAVGDDGVDLLLGYGRSSRQYGGDKK
jgi:hypothetical protein